MRGRHFQLDHNEAYDQPLGAGGIYAQLPVTATSLGRLTVFKDLRNRADKMPCGLKHKTLL